MDALYIVIAATLSVIAWEIGCRIRYRPAFSRAEVDRIITHTHLLFGTRHHETVRTLTFTEMETLEEWWGEFERAFCGNPAIITHLSRLLADIPQSTRIRGLKIDDPHHRDTAVAITRLRIILLEATRFACRSRKCAAFF